MLPRTMKPRMSRWMSLGALALTMTAVSVAQAAPVTTATLKWTPEQSHVALALPDLQALVDQIKAIDGRLHTDDSGITGDIDKMIRDLANAAGAYGASDLNAIGEARGLDATKGIGLFVDLTPTIESILKQLAEHQASQESGDESTFEADLDDAEMPLWAAVFGVQDEEKVVEAIEDLVYSSSELAYAEEGEETVGDVTIKTYDEYGYFIQGDRVALGSLAMVKGVAKRVGDEAKVRYGSNAAPAQLPHEAVALIFGQKFLPGLKAALPHLDMGGDAKPFVDAQIANLEAMFADSKSDDPLLLTLGASDEKVQLDLRIDTAEHPGVLAVSGEASPLRLAQLLPSETLALISLRLNEEGKKQFMEGYLPAIAEATGQGDDPQRMMIANQVVNMIGDELTLGVAGSPDDFPSIFLMVGLRDPEPTKGLLSMFIPSMPGETYKDVEIKSVAAPVPVPISLAFPGDMLLISNSVERMKTVIDLVSEEKTSDFFSTISLDAATPRYNAVYLNSRLFTDVVLPLASLTGGLPAGVDSVVGGLTPAVDAIRLLNEMQGSWSVTQLSATLNPPAEVDVVELAE